MSYTNINKSSLHFNTKIYTGNGSQPRAITGIGHQPDFVWLKDRDTAYHHQLYDSVRGTSAGVLYSSLADGEDSSYALSSFDSDGFTLGSNLDAVNGNNKKIVSWNWKANGAGSANTAGTINSTVSVNTTAGFSIVKWTGNGVAGASIGHGLGVVPKLIIVKRLNNTANWTVYHTSLGNTHRTELNSTGASTSDAGAWNNQTPTTTLFYTGNNLTVGNNGSNYIAYCFAEKTGYSKFGSYTGNGSTDGTFVYTGFKPSLVIIKQATDSGQHWEMFDNKRDGYNDANRRLYPNNTDAEPSASDRIRIVSNGFKAVTSGGTHVNGNGKTHIYMAWGQSLVGSNNVPCTAR